MKYMHGMFMVECVHQLYPHQLQLIFPVISTKAAVQALKPQKSDELSTSLIENSIKCTKKPSDGTNTFLLNIYHAAQKD